MTVRSKLAVMNIKFRNVNYRVDGEAFGRTRHSSAWIPSRFCLWFDPNWCNLDRGLEDEEEEEVLPSSGSGRFDLLPFWSTATRRSQGEMWQWAERTDRRWFECKCGGQETKPTGKGQEKEVSRPRGRSEVQNQFMLKIMGVLGVFERTCQRT